MSQELKGAPSLEQQARSENPAKGVLYLILAVSIVPIMDGIAKELSQSLPVVQITWARYASSLILILPIVLYAYGPRCLLVPKLKLQLLRSGCLVGATFSFFWVLKYLPIAETLALAFIYPLIVTALSPVFLGETVGWRRYLAVIIGFCGAIVIIQPGASLFQPIAIVGLVPGWFFAGYIMLTRKLAGSAPASVTLAYGTLIGAIILSLAMPAYWTAPEPSQWAMFGCLGVIASVSHFLMIKAYESAPASVLAPLGYGEMPSAVLIGWFWFGEWPNTFVWIGITIIITSGLFIFWRKTKVTETA